MVEDNVAKLKSCPFCGGEVTEIRENGRSWKGMLWSEPLSISVVHHCVKIPGQLSKRLEIIGKDMATAIEAWNRRCG